MSQYKYAEIGDTVYFWFAANTTAGSAGDGATPLYDVRKAGDSAGGAPTASGTPTLLTHANYSDGLHEIAVDTTGYSAGEYAVFCTLTISSVNPGGFVGSVLVRTAGTGALKVDAVAISGDTTAADNAEAFFDGTGYAGTNNVIPTVSAVTGLTASNLDATVSSRSTVTTAQVNAEVVDALATDTYAEPGQGAPAATTTLAAKINYLFKAWRNKSTQTATTYSLFDDAGTTVDQKSTVSDDATTATKGEIGTGP